MSLEALVHCFAIRHSRSRLIDHDDVETLNPGLMMPKRFSNHSFNAVSRRCPATVLFGDRHSKPCELLIVVAAEHCKEFIAAACSFFENPPESRGIQ
jgi:hypothetical protein